MVQNDKKKKKKREGSICGHHAGPNVSKSYRKRRAPALDNVSLHDQAGGICFYRRRQRFRKIDPDQAAFAGADAHERPCYRVNGADAGALEKRRQVPKFRRNIGNCVPGFPSAE